MNSASVRTYFLKPFLVLLVLAMVSAVVLYPLYAYFERTLKGNSALAASLTIVVVVLGLILILVLFGSSIRSEATTLYTASQDKSLSIRVGQMYGSVQDSLSKYVPALRNVSKSDVALKVQDYSQQALEWLVANAFAAFSGVGAFLLDLLLFFMALYFFLNNGLDLKKKILAMSPLTGKENETLAESLTLSVRTIVEGMFFKSIIQGVLAAIGFAFFGVPNGILWAVAVSLASLVPAVGTALVYVPVLLFVFFAHGAFAAFGLMVWWVVLAVVFVDNVVGPLLTSKGTQLHPLLVLLAALGGFSFFGPSGVILGPLSLSLFMTLLTIFNKA
jgi:predicted PurR-regulated permease PerM